jgi:hypothetical protein
LPFGDPAVPAGANFPSSRRDNSVDRASAPAAAAIGTFHSFISPLLREVI